MAVEFEYTWINFFGILHLILNLKENYFALSLVHSTLRLEAGLCNG